MRQQKNRGDRALRGTIATVSLLSLAGLALWAIGSGPSGRPAPDPADRFDGARRVSLEVAEEMARATGHPVFWAGRLPGMGIAMNRDSRTNVQVRYLPEGVDPETERDSFLTIGSYPYGRALEATTRLAGEPGRIEIDLPDGVGFLDRTGDDRIVLALRSHPDLQIEVVHPRPEWALAVIRRGAIVPIE